MHSCLIENDMSYPRVSTEITAFEVEGQESVTIDAQNRKIDIVLSESADMSALKVLNIEFTEMTRCEPWLETGDVIDLTEPMKVTLSIYQDYEWTISATQPIERYVRCGSQIGEAKISVENHLAEVSISATQPLYAVVIQDMKLEPEGAEFVGYVADVDENTGEETLEPVSFPLELDCTFQRFFDIRVKDEIIRWALNVFPMKIEMAVTSVHPWCYSADLTGEFDGNGTPRLEYRTDLEETWTVSEDAVSVNGTSLSAKLTGLTEGTLYHVRFVSGSETGKETTFTTGTPDQIENMGFDDWYNTTTSTKKEIWYPNLNSTVNVWGTANPGSGAFVGSLTTPEDSFVAVAGDGKRAARLESKYAILAFAAGNIFTGSFGKVNGLGAILDWGTPFTGRPSALKGYYSYAPVPINHVKSPYESLENTMDQCQILVILTDWTGPFTINTTEGVFVDQTKENKSIIAYGKFESAENTGEEYREFTLPLEYWRPDATPAYAVVVACASYKGDYFTGGEGSVMFVDEFEFVYE